MSEWIAAVNPFINEEIANLTPFLNLIGPAENAESIEEWVSAYAKHMRVAYSIHETKALEICRSVLSMGSEAHTRDLISALVPLGVHPGWPFFGIRPRHMLLGFLCHSRSKSQTALDNGIPTMPMFAMQKSASSYSSAVMESIIGSTTAVVSMDHRTAYRPWVQYLAQFPIALHDHMPPHPFNLGELANAGINRVAIQVRDPRQLIVSQVRHSEEFQGNTDMSEESVKKVSRDFARWINGWRVDAPKFGIAVHVVRYEDMVVDGRKFFNSILDFFNAPSIAYENLSRGLERAEEQRTHGGLNYRKGRSDEWRDVLTRQHISEVESVSAAAFEGLYSF
jgi:hypothetical protein